MVRGSRTRVPLFALALGHGCADLSSSALWALLPFLVVERGYSYHAVGLFALTASVAPAVLQPLAGAHGDRRTGFWLMPAGLLLAGLGLRAIGFLESPALTLAAVIVASAGIAAYHPEGARWARRVSGGRVNSDMGLFSLGGSVGWGLGPLVVAAALAPLGLGGTALIPIVPFAAAAALLVALRQVRRDAPVAARATAPSTLHGQEWRPFVRLLVFSSLAGGLTLGLMTFVPLFLVEEEGASPGASNVMTSVLLCAAAAGTLLGGLAAERFGRRLVLVAPQLALVPLIALLPALGYGAMLPVIVVIGLAGSTYMGIQLVLAQEYLPARMGLATGLLVGLSSGAAGLLVAALGLLGERAGAGAVLSTLAALPLAVAAFGAWLPRPRSTAPAPLTALPELQLEAES
jgi:FSR family fosmidomycin resistance protein-like MFS transporter